MKKLLFTDITDDLEGFENVIIPRRIMFEPSSEFTHGTPLKYITNQNSIATDSTAVVTNPTANKANVPSK